MDLDIDEYLYHLDGMNLTREQKEQVIRTVWGFMESEADKAFGLHPVQLSRGYANDNNLRNAKQMIESNPSQILTKFDCAANDNTYTKEQKRYG